MDANSDEENGDETKENDGVDKDGGSTGLHVVELDDSAFAGELEQKTWTQQHEQHRRDHYRAPICHCLSPQSKRSSINGEAVCGNVQVTLESDKL